MPKTPVQINFAQGLDTKTDQLQIPIGKFLSLSNSVFDTTGRLTKRNGYGTLASTVKPATYLTAYRGNLLAIGKEVQAYSQSASNWLVSGQYQPLNLSVIPVVRNAFSQSQIDSSVSPSGLLAAAYYEVTSESNRFVYSLADSTTSQNIVPPTLIPTTNGSQSFAARIFPVGNQFIYVYDSTSSGSTFPSHLQFFAVNATTAQVTSSATNVSSASYIFVANGCFDGTVSNNTLYLSWADSQLGGQVYAASIGSGLAVSAVKAISSFSARQVSVCFDDSRSTVWTSLATRGSPFAAIGWVGTDTSLNVTRATDQTTSSGGGAITSLASAAHNGVLHILAEGGSSEHYINNVSVSSAVATTQSTVVRSVGLASKAFNVSSTMYYLTAYQSTYQSTYFLIGSASQVASRLCYGNGGGYVTTSLPSSTVVGSSAYIGYLIKDSIVPVNKLTGVSSTTQTAGVYSTLGMNVVRYNFDSSKLITKESGGNLLLNGGFLWSYDGVAPTENNFFLYPDGVTVTGSGTGAGSQGLIPDTYYFHVVYNWADNQGNVFNSAPSVPTGTTIGSGTDSITIFAPLLNLSYKPQSTIGAVMYQWSASQPIYFKTLGYFQDSTHRAAGRHAFAALPPSQIIGNQVLYTNGGVVEDVGAPSFNSMNLWDSRLWGIDAEDPNLLWYSKQVVETTPVEMSDLFTLFIEPNAGAQGPTGPCKCLAPMDDKQIIFKKNAIYYINGRGPDSTGANSQYSEPIFITATVGTENQGSIVATPMGIMFQSDKGIWLLGRDLSTQYIGKDVESFNASTVLSALAIPATNQVRFTLNTGEKLVYDYFVGQWGTFNGAPAISSTLYQNLETQVNSSGQVSQETDGVYLDGATPVTMSFTTGWLNLSGLQGYYRAYRAYILGQYQSPHTYTIGLAYNYGNTITQTALINPGTTSSTEQWQVNFQQQQCQSFQMTFTEVSSSTAGAGLTLSGMNIVVGIDKGYPENIGPAKRTS